MQAMSLEFTLVDDGTMDTVVECHCPNCGKSWEERFGYDYATYFRDPDSGILDEDAFFATIREDHDIYCDCEIDK